MEQPTIEEVRDMLCITEQWFKDEDGIVRVRRWITSRTGEKRYLGEEETAFRDVPFVKMKVAGSGIEPE